MEYKNKLLKGRLIGRYKGLILDVKLEGDMIAAAFCPDDNQSSALYSKDAEVWVMRNKDNRRRLKYECQLINKGEGLVGVNPHYNNILFEEAFNARILKEFHQYNQIRRIEPKDNLRHVNFELADDAGNKCYVSIANIYNKQGQYVVFPTFLSFFDLEMLEEMSRLRADKVRTAVFILVPRMDCLETKFSWSVNPIAAAKIFDEAKNGLEFISYGCNLDKKSITISYQMPIRY